MTTVTSVALPQSSLVHQSLAEIHYCDAFRIQLGTRASVTPVLAMRAWLQGQPAWVNWLMGLRGVIARLVGLKHPSREEANAELETFRGEVGQKVSLFQVLTANTGELVTGDSDKHLDFRLSFLIESVDEQQYLTLATAVRFRGWLGRVYFLPVGPLHRFIVPATMRRAQKLLATPVASWPRL